MSLINRPRINLGNWPTPLHDLTNLSANLGGPRILIKRDDLAGLAMGGNKARQLEFIMAEIQQKGYDTVISTAGSQSNWCCQLAAAARRLKMEAAFVLFSGVHPEMQGNLLLHNILGSEIRILDGQLKMVDNRVVRTGNYGTDASRVINEMLGEFRKKGRNPIMIDHTNINDPFIHLGVSGWVEAADEIQQQLHAQKIEAQYLVCAQGSGVTHAGLVLGLKLLKLPLNVIGIAVSRPKDEGVNNVVVAASETAKSHGLDVSVTPKEVIVYDDYIGEGYGVMTEGCRKAIKLLAQTEGIFVDPVYTGKAMAGLIDLIHKGRFTSRETVIFVHTGGIPGLFPYDEELTK